MRISPLVTAATVLLLAGCQTITGKNCPLGICTDSLKVAFSRPPAGPYRVEIFPDGSPNGQVYDCDDPTRCTPPVFSGKPSRVTIVVTTGGVTSTQEFTPRYQTVRPNGQDCPGRCEQVTVTVQI